MNWLTIPLPMGGVVGSVSISFIRSAEFCSGRMILVPIQNRRYSNGPSSLNAVVAITLKLRRDYDRVRLTRAIVVRRLTLLLLMEFL